MTPDPDPDSDLDARARRAAAGLRRRVGDTPLSTDVPHRTNRRPVVVVAVAVLLVVGGFALLRVGDDSSEEGGIAGTDVPTRLAFDPIPSGMGVTGTYEGPLEDVDGFGSAYSATTLYRSTSEPGPSDRYVAAFSNLIEPREEPIEGAERVTIEGLEIDVKDLDADRVAYNLQPVGDGRGITLITAGISREAGLSLAASATHDAGGIVSVDVNLLPEGVELVGSVPIGVAIPAPSSFATLNGSAGIGYDETNQSKPDTISVSFVSTQEGWLDVSGLLLLNWHQIEVRGQPGLAGTWDDSTASGVITWVEPDGTLVRMEGNHYDVQDLVALAEDLVPITEEEWRALADESAVQRDSYGSSGTGEAPVTTESFEGTGDLIVGTVDLVFVQYDDAGERARLSPVDVADERLVTVADGVRVEHSLTSDGVLYGVVPPDTALLEIVFDDQAVEVVDWVHVSGEGTFPLWAYAIRLPFVPETYTLIATGEDGSTITRVSRSDGSTPPTITSTP